MLTSIKEMLTSIKEAHNVIGMIILFLLVLVLIAVLIGYLRKKQFGKISKTFALAALILVHLQIAIGVVLYGKQ